MPPSQEHFDVLKKYFGHNEFRPMQWEIIKSLIQDKRDTCVVMATGYGKSLCYQFPPIFCNGLAIVVSPLISLMQDQVTSLKTMNIPASFLGSAQKMERDVVKGILNNDFKLVYITPELCSSNNGERILTQISNSDVDIVLIAIDEAHCVSEWGMDFRKAYRNLSNLRNYFPGAPLLTLTATATVAVRNDICSSLNLKNPLKVCTSFDRPNLFLSASIKGDDILKDIKDLLLKFSIRSNSGSTIIYCATKKTADNVHQLLQGANINCSLYHADLSMSQREQAQKDFANDKVTLMVATVAFGMGIDKPDVRIIVHVGAPKDVETYYQEIGRAGRDGLPSFCHVLYNKADFSLNKRMISHLHGQYRQHKEEMCRVMERYLQAIECRRKILISHFDPACMLETNSRCCDNCNTTRKRKFSSNNEIDVSSLLAEDALIFLKTVNELGGRFGVTVTVFVLRGSNNKRVPKFIYKSKSFGAGLDKSEIWWKCLAGLLLRECLLEEYAVNKGSDKFPVNCIRVSSKGQHFLHEDGSKSIAKLQPTQEMLPMIKKLEPRPNKSGWIFSDGKDNTDGSVTTEADIRKTTLEDMVYNDLVKLRLILASKMNCMPYMVLSHRTMQFLSQIRPTTLKELSSIEGISDTKLSQFGEKCIECIKKNITLFDEKKIQETSSLGKNVKRFVPKTLRYKSDDITSKDGASTDNEDNSNSDNTVTEESQDKLKIDSETSQDKLKVDKITSESIFKKCEDHLKFSAMSPALSSFYTSEGDEYFTGCEDKYIQSPSSITSFSEEYYTAPEFIPSPSVPQKLNLPSKDVNGQYLISEDQSSSEDSKLCKRMKMDSNSVTNRTLQVENKQIKDSLFRSPSLAAKLESHKDKKKIVKKNIKL